MTAAPNLRVPATSIGIRDQVWQAYGSPCPMHDMSRVSPEGVFIGVASSLITEVEGAIS
jgi:hypothetical protein